MLSYELACHEHAFLYGISSFHDTFFRISKNNCNHHSPYSILWIRLPCFLPLSVLHPKQRTPICWNYRQQLLTATLLTQCSILKKMTDFISIFFQKRIRRFCWKGNCLSGPDHKEAGICIIKEITVIDSFQDFLLHVVNHNLTYSLEETTDLFRKCCKILKMQLHSWHKKPGRKRPGLLLLNHMYMASMLRDVLS